MDATQSNESLWVNEMQLDSIIDACDMKIETCLAMAFAETKNLEDALKHAALAVDAIQKALKKYPDWEMFREELVNTVTLKEGINQLISVSEVSNHFKAEFNAASRLLDSIISNMLAEKFEHEVGNYLRDKLQYEQVDCGYKPPYLSGEIDVFAKKGGQKTTITICECKLRLSKQPINKEEIVKFYEKCTKVRHYEQEKAQNEGRQVTIHSLLVTNSEMVKEETLEAAKKYKINLTQAQIPLNYRDLVSQRWKIRNFKSLLID